MLATANKTGTAKNILLKKIDNIYINLFLNIYILDDGDQVCVG